MAWWARVGVFVGGMCLPTSQGGQLHRLYAAKPSLGGWGGRSHSKEINGDVHGGGEGLGYRRSSLLRMGWAAEACFFAMVRVTTNEGAIIVTYSSCILFDINDYKCLTCFSSLYPI